jgi:hypothetical protein
MKAVIVKVVDGVLFGLLEDAKQHPAEKKNTQKEQASIGISPFIL